MSGCTLSPTTNPISNPTLFYSAATTPDIQNTQDTSVIFDIDQYENHTVIYDIYKRTEYQWKYYGNDKNSCIQWTWIKLVIGDGYILYRNILQYINGIVKWDLVLLVKNVGDVHCLTESSGQYECGII